MTHLGIGVMLNRLMADDGGDVFRTAIGKTITALSLDVDNNREDMLRITFDDGSKIALYDNGQSCCETRYMRTDDDLTHHIGATLVGGEIRDAPDIVEDGGDEAHEVQFLLITTSRGVITLSNHNEHNGYYGGFALRIIAE